MESGNSSSDLCSDSTLSCMSDSETESEITDEEITDKDVDKLGNQF